jgi:polyhydroxyalkanoate synthesis regulator phasin
MKKVYRKIVWDMGTGAVLYEDSYDYDGPVAECKGEVSVAAPQETESQKRANDAYVEYMDLLKDRMANPENYYTDTEQLINQYAKIALTDYIENMPEQEAYQDKMMSYMNQLVDYNTQQLQNIKTIKELSEYTGELTSAEKTMLDTLENNAITKITDTVNEQTQDIVSAKIAELVDKGALNSTVGTQLLSKVAESAQEAISQGTADVESARISQELSLMQSNKTNALNWANYGLNSQQILSNLATGNASQLAAPLVNASQISQYASGLQNQYANSYGNALSNYMGNQTSAYNTRYNAALQSAISSGQNTAGVAGTQWQAAGTAAAAAAAAA